MQRWGEVRSGGRRQNQPTTSWLGGSHNKNKSAALSTAPARGAWLQGPLLSATCFATCDCAQLCSSPLVRPSARSNYSVTNEWSGAQGWPILQDTEEARTKQLCFTRNTWRHHGINQHHHAPTINQPIMEKLDDHGASWKSWTTMVPTINQPPSLYSPTGGSYTPRASRSV